MSEWDFGKDIIDAARDIGIGDRVVAHFSEAEVQDTHGTVVGVVIHRYGVVDYTVHLDGDISPTDGFSHDISGHDAGSIRLLSPSSSSQARLSEAVKVLEEVVYATEITRASAGDLRKGFASYVSPASWVEQLQAHIDQSLTKAKAFITTIGENKNEA